MVPAQWFVEGWARAYQWRAKSAGHVMQPDEQRRMLYALKRMYRAQEREDEQRIANGLEPIWKAAA